MIDRPFESYLGGKGGEGTYRLLINHIPPHKLFISGCLGNCAVMRYKLPAPHGNNIGIDKDPVVISEWEKVAPEWLTLYNRDILEFLAALRRYQMDHQDTFIFLDPPYPVTTRKGHDRYRFEFTDVKHVELCHLVNQLIAARVMICTYDNPIYSQGLAGWRKLEYPNSTRGGQVIETIYMNYQLDGHLHDYRYLGTDYVDRQRIRRKVSRQIARLKRTPALERNAIITEINRQFQT